MALISLPPRSSVAHNRSYFLTQLGEEEIACCEQHSNGELPAPETPLLGVFAHQLNCVLRALPSVILMNSVSIPTLASPAGACSDPDFCDVLAQDKFQPRSQLPMVGP